MKINLKCCFLIFIFRLFNALISKTFFQPDEYYQSIEVAHRIVFGYGYQTWEWRSSNLNSTGGIRSPLHPFLFVPVYWFLKIFKLDHTQILIISPKFLQAGLATITDLATYSIASELLAPHYAASALACSLTCFFNAYSGIRTLSNSLETTLTSIALAFWPWKTDQVLHSWSNLIISILFIAITIIIRPSSILFWSALTFITLKKCSGDARVDIIALFAVIGTISALICLIIDSSFYGLPTFTPFNFVRENLFNDVSSFYGINSWHYYFTQGFTFVNFSLFPTVILGMILLDTPRSIYESPGSLIRLKSARFTILTTLIGLSFVKHKEFRFIQPLIPLFNCFASRAMVNNYLKFREKYPVNNLNQVNFLEKILLTRSVGFILRSIISLSFGFYLLRYHYSAQVSVMDFLRKIPNHQLQSVGFLMPCHSTPWQSHLHKPHLASNGTEERLWMLSCEPPLTPLRNNTSINLNNATEEFLQESSGDQATVGESVKLKTSSISNNIKIIYRDESDEFYEDAMKFLKNKFPDHVNERFPPTTRDQLNGGMTTRFEWPSHLVLFESLWNLIPVRELLIQKGYQIIWSQWNSRWHDDPRRAGHVMVLNWIPPS